MEPDTPIQDSYENGFDVVRMIATEFGLSPMNVRQQVAHANTVIEIDGVQYVSKDRFFIPVEMAEGKWVNVIGPERQWRMKFPTVSE